MSLEDKGYLSTYLASSSEMDKFVLNNACWLYVVQSYASANTERFGH